MMKNEKILVNCHINDTDYPYEIFCTAGLSLLVIWELAKKFNLDEKFISSIVDLASIGTIGDVMPLVEFNKTIVKAGLKRIISGIANQCILELLPATKFAASSLAFYVVPCLNAAGRISQAYIAINALLAKGSVKESAMELQALNQRRKVMEKELLNEVLLNTDLSTNVIIARSAEWHPGLVGIIAGRLKEEFSKTAFVLYKIGNLWKGSARGNKVGELIEKSIKAGLAVSGGGHSAAGGVTVHEDKIYAWIEWVNEQEVVNVNNIIIDAIAHESHLLQGFGDLAQFGPFGAGNPVPKFLLKNVWIKNTYFYEGGHMKLTLHNGVKIMAFRCGSWMKEVKNGSVYDIVISVDEVGDIKLEDMRLV